MTKPKTINKENLNKYLARLRDPNSKQIKHRYTDGEGGFCAIGHLMDLIKSGTLNKDNQHDVGFGPQRHYLGFPIGSEDWTNIATRASIYNDHRSYTLPQLADFIEGRVKEYLGEQDND